MGGDAAAGGDSGVGGGRRGDATLPVVLGGATGTAFIWHGGARLESGGVSTAVTIKVLET